jgi:acetyl-CoA/propionyl-CoA carboxylase biotin carboxyl carrier protein
LIAKLVAYGASREIAIARMRRALAEIEIEGVASTVPLHTQVMASDAFLAADLSTSFLIDHPDVIPPAALINPDQAGESHWSEQVIEVNGRRFQVRVPARSANGARPDASSRRRERIRHPARGKANGPEFVSPIQGSVLRVLKSVGDPVSAGDPILVVEAMKMENELRAQCDGYLTALDVAVGASVKVGDHLFTIDSPAS